jgi:PPOX class probable F420-dependent enzyme
MSGSLAPMPPRFALVELELEARLAAAEVLWLTTVDERGQPQTSPVWFVWHGGAFHVASEPGAGKVANIGARPRVSVHLDGAGAGDLVVTVEGIGSITAGLTPEAAERYLAKYSDGFQRLEMTPADYLAQFSTGVEVAPIRWRVFPSS